MKKKPSKVESRKVSQYDFNNSKIQSLNKLGQANRNNQFPQGRNITSRSIASRQKEDELNYKDCIHLERIDYKI